MIPLLFLAACVDQLAEGGDTAVELGEVLAAETDTGAELGDTAADTDTGADPDTDTGEAVDEGDTSAETDAADQVFAHPCDDGSAASYSYRFPVRFEVGTRPEAGLWTVYDPAYLAWYAEVVGVDTPAATYTEAIALDAEGYATAVCAWLDGGTSFRGFVAERVELVVAG